MANDQAKQVLQQGIAAARAGNNAQARQLLQEAVKRDPQSETAWLWLSSVAKDDKERIFCLKQILNLNPNNENAIRGLRQLGINVDAAEEEDSVPSGITQQVGTPLVDEQKLNASMSQLDPILSNYQPVPMRDLPYQWTKKKRGRVGDSSAMILRSAVAGGVIVLVLALLGGAGYLLSKFGGVNVAIFTTPTPLPSPTPTMTPTPGYTDTPSPTPRASATPSATPGEKVQKGNIYDRQATPIYPKVASDRVVKDALDLAVVGNYTDAEKKLEDELKARENVKDDSYYAIVYYLAKMYVDGGDPERAQGLLNGNKPEKSSPTYGAALGYALYALKDYDDALKEADTALKADGAISLAALVEARILSDRKSYTDARRTLNLGIESNPSNGLLIVERGKTYLAEANYKQAESDALLALYIDPLNRDAYILRIQSILGDAATLSDKSAAVLRYGSAVLATKDFLLWYPSDTIAWKLLGDARQGEENFTEAMNAYTQAVVSDQKSVDAQQVFLARGNLLMKQRRYEEAYTDFDQALQIGQTPEALQGRFDAAVQIKNFTSATADIAALVQLKPDNAQLKLTQIDLLIRTGEFTSAGSIMTDKFFNDVPKELKAEAQLYRGIIRFKTSDRNGQGLDDLNAALAAQESGIGHYYRGQVFESINQPSDALVDYQWLQYWNQIYNYDFMSDVTSRIAHVQSQLPSPTPSSTPTPTKPVTPTKTPRVSPTPTATDTDTLTPTPTLTASPTGAASLEASATDAATATESATEPTATP